MNLNSSPETVRPPVFLGCFLAAAVVVVAIGIAAFAIRFLESGAQTGEVKLELAEAYGPGGIEFNSSGNFFLVRLSNGDFVALSDLDSANRESQSRRCRVSPIGLDSPDLLVARASLEAQISPQAGGSSVVLQEACFGALYDVAGIRLNGPGANLDRHPVRIASDGKVTVKTSERLCTRRTLSAFSEAANC